MKPDSIIGKCLVVQHGMAVCTPTGARRYEARRIRQRRIDAKAKMAKSDRLRNGRGDSPPEAKGPRGTAFMDGWNR